MRENNHQSINSAGGRAQLQVIAGGRKTGGRATSATAMNQHIKKSIHRVVLEGELPISNLRHVAEMFGIEGPGREAKIIDVLRETYRAVTMRPLPPATGMYPDRYSDRRAA